MNDDLRELLYRSFDSELSADEASTLDAGLKDSAELRTERDMIASMRGAVSRSVAQSFSMGFADRVMERILPSAQNVSRDESLQDSIRRIFRVVAIAAAPVCIALAIWNLQVNGTAVTNAGAEDEMAVVFETPLQSILGDSQ
jgi:anti-sigma factor RsiW